MEEELLRFEIKNLYATIFSLMTTPYPAEARTKQRLHPRNRGE
jgi:hypothetical protein